MPLVIFLFSLSPVVTDTSKIKMPESDFHKIERKVEVIPDLLVVSDLKKSISKKS